jgi:hypothetical protein
MSEEVMFTVGGRQVTAAQFKATAKKAPSRVSAQASKRVESRSDANISQGFAVLGYSPDHWSQKDAAYREAIKAYEAAPETAKHPGTPDEFELRWMARNKPKRARSNPYELEEAADLCAEMMRKAGWLHVHVEELLRRSDDPALI